MRQKIIGTGVGLMLVSLAAVGAFASQDAVNLLEDPTATATATGTVDATETATPEGTETPAPTATQTPDGTATATPTAASTGTPEATATGGPTDTPTAEPTSTDGEDDDVHGIPDSNPSKHDEDGDGVCEKGETVIKTTPSGVRVRVPCHAAKDKGAEKHGNGHGHSGGDDADDDEGDEVED